MTLICPRAIDQVDHMPSRPLVLLLELVHSAAGIAGRCAATTR